MFLMQKKENERIPFFPGLNRKEQKKAEEIVKKARDSDGAQRTAQQTLPFERMFPDGICRVRNGYYTKTVRFFDISYELADEEEKGAIFEQWCSFLNFFDSSIHFELSFFNRKTDVREVEKSIRIPKRSDGFNEVRAEYQQMLRRQIIRGNNGLTKEKYVTFGIDAPSMRQAKPRLESVQTDVINNFRRLGVRALPLDGRERLKLMHDMLHIGEEEAFLFDWDELARTGRSVKDAIAPASFEFRKSRSCRMGGMYCSVSSIYIAASKLSDSMLKDLLKTESDQIVTLHVQSVDMDKAIKQVKSKLSSLQSSKIDEQKKAVRSGYDMDIMPSDLIAYTKDVAKLLQELQSEDERMFFLNFLILNVGKTEEELENRILRTSSLVQQRSCLLHRLDYQQEQGLMSCLPLADCQIQDERNMTTSSMAIMIPFTTQELFQNRKEALYYGLNAVSNNLIMADRKSLKTPNGLILGTPGSGKSFAAKREMTNVFLSTKDDIMICDPESEYTPLVKKLGGQVIKVGPSSRQYINPMDIHQNYAEEEDPISLKSDLLSSICEVAVSRREGLSGMEKSVIDRCVRHIYIPYLSSPDQRKSPVLEDLYNELLKQPEPEAKQVAAALEIFVKGSLNVFNHRTNVNINNRFVCYDIKGLGKQLKRMGMLIVQDQVWGRVSANRDRGRTTRYYIDEFHLLLKEEETANYCVEIWKRFRKWGGIPTGITQNIKDLREGKQVENIFENSDFIYMLNQGGGDREILSRYLNISPEELKYITDSGEGEGLLRFGDIMIPFIDQFPKDLELYRIMTTKPSEVVPEHGKEGTEYGR